MEQYVPTERMKSTTEIFIALTGAASESLFPIQSTLNSSRGHLDFMYTHLGYTVVGPFLALQQS